jgi:hypothetical protein
MIDLFKSNKDDSITLEDDTIILDIALGQIKYNMYYDK